MLVKGKQATRFAQKPDPDTWAVVAFCADEGLANDAAAAVISAWSKRHGEFEITRLEDDAIRKDPSLLFDSLEAVSLLGEPRLIRVRTSGDKIGALLTEAITEGDTAINRYAARLVIECGALTKKSKLRTAAEKAKYTACLQLFADESEDIEARIQTAMSQIGAEIDPRALEAFIGDLPGHRTIANSEIEKLSLYARGLGRPVSVEDVRRLSATDLDHDLSAAIRDALDGKPEAAHVALDRLAVAGTSGISILRALQFETLRMLDAQSRITSGQSNPGMKLRPPVWQSDWPTFRARLTKWPTKRLMRIMERIYEAERQAKSAGDSAAVVVRMLVNEVARAAEAAR